MDDLLTHWYTALREPIGLCLRTNDRNLLRQRLYAIRARAKDEALEKLSIIFSPNEEDQLWIIKNESSAQPVGTRRLFVPEQF